MPKGKGGGGGGGGGKGKAAAAAAGGGGGAEKVKTASHAKCRHILCEKQGKIMEALAKLKEGQSFASVAQAYSEDKARDGGNLGFVLSGERETGRQREGALFFSSFLFLCVCLYHSLSRRIVRAHRWMARNQMVGPFAEKAFSVPTGKFTEPFKTQFGWHILLVEERKA
jgi:NIMA-interacting peptidyl-prolyl cis-trans isomerase 4